MNQCASWNLQTAPHCIVHIELNTAKVRQSCHRKARKHIVFQLWFQMILFAFHYLTDRIGRTNLLIGNDAGRQLRGTIAKQVSAIKNGCLMRTMVPVDAFINLAHFFDADRIFQMCQ